MLLELMELQQFPLVPTKTFDRLHRHFGLGLLAEGERGFRTFSFSFFLSSSRVDSL